VSLAKNLALAAFETNILDKRREFSRLKLK